MSIIDNLKRLVTPENVNCIPKDAVFEEIEEEYLPSFKYHQRQENGFIWFVVSCGKEMDIKWLVNHFGKHIQYGDILVDYARLKPYVIPILLHAGVPPNGIFERWVFFGDPTKERDRKIMKVIIKTPKAVNWEWWNRLSPPRPVWVANLLNRYKRRRERCRIAVMALLKAFRTRPLGIDKFVLRQIVDGVWETRYTSVWTRNILKFKKRVC